MQQLQKAQHVSEELVLASVSHAEVKVITNTAWQTPWHGLAVPFPALITQPNFLAAVPLFSQHCFPAGGGLCCAVLCLLPSAHSVSLVAVQLPASSRCKLKLAAETTCKCKSAFSVQAVVVFSPSVGISSKQYAPAPSWVRGGVPTHGA